MHVDVAQTLSHKSVFIDKEKDLIVPCSVCLRKGIKERKNFPAIAKIPTGQFPDNKGVAENEPLLQKALKAGISFAEMGHPDRCIN